MTEPEELDDDLFADLYDGDDAPPKAQAAAAEPEIDLGPAQSTTAAQPDVKPDVDQFNAAPANDYGPTGGGLQAEAPGAEHTQLDTSGHNEQPKPAEEPRPIGLKEDGKMFIGGLNWETTDQSLKDYFSTFGEVAECMVMRDNATGRSRGFGFLTFKDPKTVNIVMVKEHYLDGKIIDPKRAIPRDEQERTSKIFVGGVSQEANEQVFKDYFAQYGRVIDATLMMDKDTGRPRGFGFVTFDSDSAVENVLNGDLTILGKPIEVKKAQPRGDMTEGGGESLGRGGRGRTFRNGQMDGGGFGGGNQAGGFGGANMGGMTPQMMAQYWQKMQQYFAAMQQQMASMQGMGGGMGGMNPAMMQQMQMQQMRQMQMAQQQQGGGGGGGDSGGGAGGQMSPQMMQQMQQQMQQQMMQGGQQGGGGGGGQGGDWEGGSNYDQGQGDGGPGMGMGMGMGRGGGRGRGRGGRGGGGYDRYPSAPQSAPPANAPTGPKNPGRGGGTYRGGGRGGHRGGFHPYAR